MKRCPQCRLDYFDEMIEFCLEDGSRLVLVSNSLEDEIPTVTKLNKSNPSTQDTVNLPFSNIPPTLETNLPNKAETPSSVETAKTNDLKEKAVSQSYKALEIAPIVVSLAHNWWQWVYLNNQYYSSFSAYVFSANFLMWLLLLIASAAVGLLALKLCSNKGFAYTGLVILAINLLLFLVPKR